MSFWDRMAARARPVGVIAAVENPRTVVWILSGALALSIVSAINQTLVFARFDEPAAAWVSGLLAAAYLAAWLWFATTGGVLGALVVALGASTVQATFVHVDLGGYANSGASMMWSIAIVLSGALVFRMRVTIAMAVVFGAAAIALGFLENTLRAGRSAPDPGLPPLLFVSVLVGNLAILSVIFFSLLARLRRERQRAEALLLNVLPAEVAIELKEQGEVAPRRHPSISVLFADIVGFTPLAATLEPEEVVGRLNGAFTHFDALADRYGVEKIKSIGDNYMVAAGVPTPRADHAQALVCMALDMLAYGEAHRLGFRIGIHSGPAVAGVIGARKFQYDLWGDTVNLASRMESQGSPGHVQISESTFELLDERFSTTERGIVDVKGRGPVRTWFVDGVSDTPAAAP